MQHATARISRGLAAGLLALGAMLPATAHCGDAAAVVDELHSALLTIMQEAKQLGYEGRRERIAPVVRRSFDLPFITRFALGRYWPELSGEQRDAMVDVFSRWTIAHYAARFNGYSGEHFDTVSTAPARKGRELVRTVLASTKDPSRNVSLDYLLHETEQGWRIINVIANGVSDLSLKRADYGSVVKAGGVDSLISKLNGQIEMFASER